MRWFVYAGQVGAWLASGWRWLTGSQFLSGAAVGALLVFLFSKRLRHDTSVTFNLPFNLGSTTVTARHADRVAAWKLYVQLTTRKAAIPFDEEHDVIAEVYDSFRTLFEESRRLLLDLPPSEFVNRDGIASLMLRVLNDGVRPHLTRWQAEYRRWWATAASLPANASRCPQDIQRDFPRYAELVRDLRGANTELSKFADALLLIARGMREEPRPSGRAYPTPPTTREGTDSATEDMLPPPARGPNAREEPTPASPTPGTPPSETGAGCA